VYQKDPPPSRWPDWQVPPWRLPGNFRLDCEPHHGALWRWLANLALVFCLGSWAAFLNSPLFCLKGDPTAAVTAAFGLAIAAAALGLPAWLLARRELARMHAGVVDPSGQWETKFARDRGRRVFLLSLLVTLGGLLFLL
jgi:ABC-type branched-subunit amino acid transport system permease subunit